MPCHAERDAPDRGRRRQILSGQDPVHIFGEGNEIRSFIALGDLVRGIRLAIESPDAVNTDFNLCRGKGILGCEATTPLDAMLDQVSAWVRDEMEAGVLTSETRA